MPLVSMAQSMAVLAASASCSKKREVIVSRSFLSVPLEILCNALISSMVIFPSIFRILPFVASLNQNLDFWSRARRAVGFRLPFGLWWRTIIAYETDCFVPEAWPLVYY